MRRRLIAVAVFAAIVVGAAAAGVLPISVDLAIDAAVVVGALTLVRLLAAETRTPEVPVGGPAPAARIEPLDAAIRLVSQSRATILGARFRLRPLLFDIAEHRLARAHGGSLDDQRGAAPLVGPQVYQLLVESEPPEDRGARGWSLEEIDAVMEAIERLGAR